MLLAASQALADYVHEDKIKIGEIYPELGELRQISAVVRAPLQAVTHLCWHAQNDITLAPDHLMLSILHFVQQVQ